MLEKIRNSNYQADDLLSDIQKENINKALSEVKESIKCGNAALALGAGVTKPCEMPSWEELISKMLGYAMQYEVYQNAMGYSSVDSMGENEKNIVWQLSRKLIDGDLKVLQSVDVLESAEYVVQFFETPNLQAYEWTALSQDAIRTMISKIIDSAKKPVETCGVEFDEYKKEPKSDEKEKKLASKNTILAVARLLYKSDGLKKALVYNLNP